MDIKIPDEVQCGAHTYSIVYNNKLDRIERMRGISNHFLQKLELDSGEEGTRLMGTLVHEFVHIADRIFNNQSMNEETVEAIGEGLTHILLSMGIRFVR